MKYYQKNVCINNINMIYYDRIDVFKGKDFTKASGSKYDICHYGIYQIKDFLTAFD